MLGSLRNLFIAPKARSDADAPDAATRLELAGAALLFEVIKADHEMDDREFASIAEVLRAGSARNAADVEELIELARRESGAATSLYEFTSLINEHCSYEEKCVLIRNMWRIAYADSQISKYEDHLIRKVSDLIYVSHSDFIRAKLAEKKQSAMSE
ncbi:MAG: TerB family tellurite resistance protein [Gammaproteobacteria bacterium]|nr:TerB family tellurite resistance protein [Gammaproteobacteria bacterium]